MDSRVDRSKAERLGALAALRRTDTALEYRQIESFCDGRYASPFVVPWTIEAANENADVFILAQDWASENFLNGKFDPVMAQRGHNPCLETNKNLKQRLKQHLGISFEQTYATDLFPFVKPGAMGARIKTEDLRHCATKYALPQIEIVRPKIVLCLGRSTTFPAIAKALGADLTHEMRRSAPIGPLSFAGAKVFGLYHTSKRSSRWIGRVDDEWNVVAAHFAKLMGKRRH